MKRARGKNSKNRYDNIDVPEVLKFNSSTRQGQQKSTPTKTTTRKPNTKGTVTKRKSSKKKQKRRARPLLLLLLAILILFLIFMGMNWSIGDETGALVPVDMEKGKLNVLVLGVDKDGLRTDAMLLVSYDLKETKAELLSVPRDTQIRVTDRGVVRKINEIHAMHGTNNKLLGPLGSIKAIEALTSVPIHYYIEFSFDAIDELASALGPIEFDVPDIEGNGKGMNYDDPAQDLHIHLKPGLQKLRGNEVQQFLRYRKSNNGSGDGSDLSRVKRQQEFLKAIVDQKVNIGLIAKIPSIYSRLKDNIKTNFSAADAVKYAKYLNGLKSENITSHNLPGESKNTRSGWYFVCDLYETEILIKETFGYDANDLTNRITVNDIGGTNKVLSSKNSSSSKNENNNEPEDIPPSPVSPTPEVTEDDYESNDVNYDNNDTTGEPEDPQETPPVTPSIPDMPSDDSDVEDDIITLE